MMMPILKSNIGLARRRGHVFVLIMLVSCVAPSSWAKRAPAGSELVDALRLAKNRQYEAASMALFSISQSPSYSERKDQITYILGLMLYQMGHYQTSAFQFINVIKSGSKQYTKPSLEKLSLAADALGDDTLLNYAMSKVELSDYPVVHRDMLAFRLGEIQARAGKLNAAVASYRRVSKRSALYSKAKYEQAVILAQTGQVTEALKNIDEVIELTRDLPINDSARVTALMAKARLHYQAKNWEEAISWYRSIPRDTEAWHDMLFESAWAMLRAGKFRSSMSQFQSLHSDYYQNFYQPESLLLRSIVYLYICQYDEMEKVLDIFTEVYRPIYTALNEYRKKYSASEQYLDDLVGVVATLRLSDNDSTAVRHGLSASVFRSIMKESDVQLALSYINAIRREIKRTGARSAQWQQSSLGVYTKKILETRLNKARQSAGRLVQNHLYQRQKELFDFFEQEGFIRFELIKGKKAAVRAQAQESQRIDSDQERDFYVQNGYSYWPFAGEYWLDEIGNYHYVGTSSCQ